MEELRQRMSCCNGDVTHGKIILLKIKKLLDHRREIGCTTCKSNNVMTNKDDKRHTTVMQYRNGIHGKSA